MISSTGFIRLYVVAVYPSRNVVSFRIQLIRSTKTTSSFITTLVSGIENDIANGTLNSTGDFAINRNATITIDSMCNKLVFFSPQMMIYYLIMCIL